MTAAAGMQVSATNLEPGGIAIVLVVTEDTWRGPSGSNIMSVPAAYVLRFADETPPRFVDGRPTLINVGFVQATAEFRLNEPGTVYYAVLPASSSDVPTPGMPQHQVYN